MGISVLAQKGRFPLMVGRVVLGVIFIYAGYSKLHIDGRWHLADYHFLFAFTIDSYQIPMLPLWFVLWTARILPWLELSLGTLLILGIGLRWTSSAICSLLFVFMALLTRAAILGLDINCGCYGSTYVKPSTELRNDSGLMVLALAVTIGAFLSRRNQRTIEASI